MAKLNRLLIVTMLLAAFALTLVGVVAAIPEGSAVLVWTVQGAAAPGTQGASTPGQIGLMDGTGAITPLLDLPAGTSYVQPCTESATSPDGRHFVFYVGKESGDDDQGEVYLVTGQNAPVSIRNLATDPLLRTVCLGNGTVQYSPDSSKLGYIAFEPGSGTDDFADGFLKIYDIATGNFVFTRESVTAFDVIANQVAFVNIFTNENGEADEIAVQIWDEARGADAEVASLRPDAFEAPEGRIPTRCKYESASVNYLADGRLSVIVGQSCFGGPAAEVNTSWILYIVDITDLSNISTSRVAEARILDGSTGGYQAFARTNGQFNTPDGGGLLFSVPDAITANTASLVYMPLDTLEPRLLVENQMVFPGTTSTNNAIPQLSLDGRWLAAVQTSVNNEARLLVYDMNMVNDPSYQPYQFIPPSAGDKIQAIEFTQDSSRVYIIIGGDEGGAQGGENAITGINLADGSSFNVERGRFSEALVVSPDGSELVVHDYKRLEDPTQPVYMNTLSITLDGPFSEIVELFVGADILPDGTIDEDNMRFAAPLAWRAP
jgi:hypothetical protein